MKDPNGKMVTRGIAAPAKKEATSLILSIDGQVTAGKDGAVFIRVEPLGGEFQGPYSAMSEVAINNVFPYAPHVPANVRAMEFPFLKVDTLGWASSGRTQSLSVRDDATGINSYLTL